MSNPLRHVGQTARPEQEPKPSPAEAAGEASPNPAGDTASTLEQHPRTNDAAPPAAPTGPRGVQKEIKDLKPGEPPPESSAGS